MDSFLIYIKQLSLDKTGKFYLSYVYIELKSIF